MAGTDVLAEHEINPDAGIPQAELGVFAHPVDTFVSPSAGTSLAQLAHSLRDTAPELGQLANTLLQHEKTVEERQAQKLATPENLAKSKGDFNKLLDMGPENGGILHFAHPFLKIYGREQFGYVAAEKAMADMKADPKVSTALDGATTMAQYDTVTQKYMQDWEKDNLSDQSHNDQIFRASFEKMRTAKILDDRNSMARKINENFLGQTLATYQSGQSAVMREHIEQGQFLGEKGYNGALVDTLASQYFAFTESGASPKMAAEALAGSIDSLAKDVMNGTLGHGEITVADVFAIAKSLPGLNGQSLYDEPKMQELRAATLERNLTETRIKNTIRQQQDRQSISQARTSAYSQLLQDKASGTIKSPDAYTEQLQVVDPQAAARFRKDYDNLTGGTWQTNEGVYSDLWKKYTDHPDRDDPDGLTRENISDALAAHDLAPKDAISLLSKLDRRARGATDKGPEADPVFTHYFQQLKTGVTGCEDCMVGGEKSWAQKMVNLTVMQDWDSWLPSHPSATGEQKSKHLLEVYDQALHHFVSADVLREMHYTGFSALNIAHKPSADYAREPILPQDFVEELAGSLRRNKPLDIVAMQKLAAYGLTNPSDAFAAIRDQALLYGIDMTPKKPSEGSNP